MFLSPCQLILLFVHEISLVPMDQLEPVFSFIGVTQDRTKMQAVIHATGAISVFILGIIYLRSRRLDIMHAMYEHENLSERDEYGTPYRISVSKPNKKGRKSEPILHQEFMDNDSSFDREEDDQYLVWKIYDKLIDAFTSEFVVLNL
jgi:hypothetical protein